MGTKKIGLLTKLGCMLIGWDATILQSCGEASFRALRKYMSAIIILAVLWGTIGFCFADRYIGIESLVGKIGVAGVFITIIICIERFIILTVGKLGKMAFFRIALACLMAVLGSTVFDQLIFSNDINVKMTEIRTEQINREIPLRLIHIENEVLTISNQIDSMSAATAEIYGKLAANPVIKATDVSTSNVVTGYDEDGKPIYAKQTTVATKNVENPLAAQARANEEHLKQLTEQLATLQGKKLSVADDVRKEYESARTGFLEELHAMFEILTNDNVALTIYGIMFTFLLMLELLVVSSKAGDSSCDYDKIVEHQLKIKAATLERTERGLLKSKIDIE